MVKISIAWAKCRKNFACRLVVELMCPMLAGLTWAYVAWRANKEWFDVASAFGIGFFFILSLQSVFLRIDKNVRDDKDADDFRESFASIQEGLDELRKQSVPTQPPPRIPPEEDLMLQAQAALSNGYYFAAAATAAIEFERIVRELARTVQLRPTLSLGQIVRDLSELAEDKDLHHQLSTLVRIRNGLIHHQLDGPLSKDQAEELIPAFQYGIERLKAAMPRIQESWRRHE